MLMRLVDHDTPGSPQLSKHFAIRLTLTFGALPDENAQNVLLLAQTGIVQNVPKTRGGVKLTSRYFVRFSASQCYEGPGEATRARLSSSL
jgi:hypothetical protein